MMGKKLFSETPVGQIDERTIMFSRKLLEPGTQRFREYYAEFPEHKDADDNFRSKPGLLSENASFYDPITFAASKAIFESVTAFHPYLDREAAGTRVEFDPSRLADSIKRWILKEGAVSVGFCETRDYHWYSKIGRGKDYGKDGRTHTSC